MPSESQHRSKADRNRKFLDSISIDDFPEWVVVVAFYTAVHLVERLRAAAGEGHSISHEDRLYYVQHRLPMIHTSYHILQNVSMLARYQSVADFFGQFQANDVTDKIINTWLAQIEKHVQEAFAN